MSDHTNNDNASRSKAKPPNQQPDKQLKVREQVQRAVQNEGELATTGFGQAQGEVLLRQTTLPTTGVNTHHLLRSPSLSPPGIIQAKIEINNPGDVYEQEADQVADQVMRMPSHLNWVGRPAPTLPKLQLKYSASEQQQRVIARSGKINTPEVTGKTEDNINKMRGGGEPLPGETRAFFEERMGADFSQVRVHTDSNAVQTSRDIQARAFTLGNHIAFNSGEYSPDTSAGKRLLAHELAHTIQQGVSGPLQRAPEPAEEVCPTCGGKGGGACPHCSAKATVELEQSPGVIAPQAEQMADPGAATQQVESEFESLKKEATEKLGQNNVQTEEGAAAMESEKEHLIARAETVMEEKGAAAPPGVKAKVGGIVGKARELWAKVRNDSTEDTAVAAAQAQAMATTPIRLKARAGGPNTANPQTIQRQLGRGQTLNSGTRTRMERAFDRSFSDVRIHTDTTAVQLSRQLNARAFAVGNNIAFDAGEYRPGTIIGEALIAHELAHVSQQSGAAGPQAMAKGYENETAIEQDADRSAVNAMLSIWSGGKVEGGSLGGEVMPRLQTGLGLHRCSSSSNCSTTVPTPQKSLTVNVTRFAGGPSLPTAKIKEIYDKANITVNIGNDETKDATQTSAVLGSDNILDASPSGALTAEETAMLALNRSPGAVTAYHIPANDRGVLGHAYRSRGHNAFFYSSNNPRSWPHELGHVLGLGHKNDVPDNIMCQTSTASGVDCWTDEQLTTIRSNGLVS